MPATWWRRPIARSRSARSRPGTAVRSSCGRPIFSGSCPRLPDSTRPAFAWLNTKGAFAMLSPLAPSPALAELMAGRDPILVVFDGSPEQIHAASRTRISGLIMDLMLIETLEPGDQGPRSPLILEGRRRTFGHDTGCRIRKSESDVGTAGDPPWDHLPSRRFWHGKGGGVARPQRGGQVHPDPHPPRISPAERRPRPHPGPGLPQQHGPVENRLHARERLVRRGDDGGHVPASNGRTVGPPAEGGARKGARGAVPRGARRGALPGAADLLVRDEADGEARPGDRPRARAGGAGRTDQRARSGRAPPDAQARRGDERASRG